MYLGFFNKQYNAHETQTKRMNKRFAQTIRKTHDARNEQTNHWSVHVTIYYPMINDPVSTEVQYSIVLLFEWLFVQIDVIN